MKITFNSQPTVLPPEVETVAELMKWKNITGGAAVTLNQKLLPRSKWTTTSLKEDDVVLVITAAFGG